jgi:GNAT superfamily N-acetyltransferase
MTGFDENDRFRTAMFEDSNRVKFGRPVDDAGQQWWLATFFEPFDLTPEAMGDLVTKSLVSDKSIIYHYIDGQKQSFSVRVGGGLPDDQGIWFVRRSFEMRGSVFNADEMFITPDGQDSGRGRRLMGDLIAASQKIGAERIHVEARNIGQYAWLRLGFVPDSGSWRNMQAELPRYVQRHESRLGRALTADIIRQALAGGPETARVLAAIRHPVPSREKFDLHGMPIDVPLGKAMFLETNSYWTGSFNLRDEASLAIATDYIKNERHRDG